MNDLIISKLEDLARLRKAQGANAFRSGAYSKAAQLISHLDTEIEDADQLYAIDGIGDKIVLAVSLIIKTGSHPELDENKDFMVPIKELTQVPGIGEKRAIDLISKGIDSIDELKTAVLDGRVKKKDKMLEAIAFVEMNAGGRIPRKYVEPASVAVLERLQALPSVERADLAGSMRRLLETVKDVDILVCSTDPRAVMDEFLECGTEIESGETQASIFKWFTFGNHGPRRFRMDLMIIPRESYGAALCHFTGSKEHNIRLRSLAKKRGITVSQNGITGPGGEWLGGEEEKDLYEVLGLDYIEPLERVK